MKIAVIDGNRLEVEEELEDKWTTYYPPKTIRGISSENPNGNDWMNGFWYGQGVLLAEMGLPVTEELNKVRE